MRDWRWDYGDQPDQQNAKTAMFYKSRNPEPAGVREKNKNWGEMDVMLTQQRKNRSSCQLRLHSHVLLLLDV